MSLIPTKCPTCNSDVEWVGVDIRCTNFNCVGIQSKRVYHFIKNCGIENVTDTSLVKWGIFNFKKLSNWKPDTYYKSEVQFYEELQKKVYSKTPEELFSAMAFDGAGTKSIKKLFDFYGDLIKTSEELYVKKTSNFPEGIGQTTIDKIAKDWHNNIKILKHITSDVRYNPIQTVKQNGKLNGMSFCITGTLSQPRKHFENLVTDNGGSLGSVSKNLSYLIAGTDAGSKLDKAQKLGIKIINEDEFMKMI